MGYQKGVWQDTTIQFYDGEYSAQILDCYTYHLVHMPELRCVVFEARPKNCQLILIVIINNNKI